MLCQFNITGRLLVLVLVLLLAQGRGTLRTSAVSVGLPAGHVVMIHHASRLSYVEVVVCVVVPIGNHLRLQRARAATKT